MAELSESAKLDLSELEKEEARKKQACPSEKTPPRSMLGWSVRGSDAPYSVVFPEFSEEEEELAADLIEKLREASKKEELEDKQEVEARIKALLVDHCIKNSIFMEKDQFAYLAMAAVATAHGFGCIDFLLDDDDLEEIAVTGLNKPVRVFHRKRGWLATNLFIESEDHAISIINKMARPLGRRITLNSPRLNAVLPNGSRLHASIPPISQIELTIRKFRSNPISIPELISFTTFSPDSLAFLWNVLEHDASLLIAGNTASGKTTTLNALFSFIPLSERVVITEDSPEINIPHEHSIKLLANPELGIPLRELVSDCIRMRPDRVIVGEVRTREEVQALLETLLSGQARGSYATFHADSGDEALSRLRFLGASEADLRAIDLILIQRRILRRSRQSTKLIETRRAFEITEVAPGARGELKLNKIFSYNPRRDSLERTRSPSLLARKISEVLGESEKSFWARAKKRASFLSSLSRDAGLRFADSVSRIQEHAQGE